MIPHQAVGVAEPVVPLYDPAQNRKKGPPVRIIPEDRLPGVAAGGDVIEGAGVFDAQRAGHEGRIE